MMLLKKDNIKFVLLFLLIVGWILFSGRTGSDFFWSYGFSFNVANGLIPYSDFNMITTPFSQILLSIPLKIFGKGMHIYAVFYALIITFMVYLFDKLYKEKGWAAILVLFNPLFLFPIFVTTCSYNILLILFVLVLIYLEKNNKSPFIIGIILGLSLFTKQNIGVLFILCEILFSLKDKKKLGIKMLGLLSVSLLFLIYFIVTGSLYSFIDQAILGLVSFENENSYHSGIYFYLSIIMLIWGLIYILKNRSLENSLIFGAILLVSPLYDNAHFIMGLAMFVLLIIKDAKISFYKNILSSIVLAVEFIILGIIVYNNFTNDYIYPTKVKYFNYFYHPKDVILENRELANYIHKNNYKSVVVFDTNSYYYKISNDLKFNKYLDLMSEGNYGTGGSKNAINEIKSLDEDTIYIFNLKLVEEYPLYPRSQLDIKTLEYFLEHAEKIDELGKLSIYKYTK